MSLKKNIKNIFFTSKFKKISQKYQKYHFYQKNIKNISEQFKIHPQYPSVSGAKPRKKDLKIIFEWQDKVFYIIRIFFM